MLQCTSSMGCDVCWALQSGQLQQQACAVVGQRCRPKRCCHLHTLMVVATPDCAGCEAY